MKVCLVSSGIETKNCRLQPWRYLLDLGAYVRADHIDIVIISDGLPTLAAEREVEGIKVRRLAHFGGRQMEEAFREEQPDLVFWHLGLTSFLHLDIPLLDDTPIIGIFTSPIYKPAELLRLGLWQLVRSHRLTAAHLLGLLVSGRLIHHASSHRKLAGLITECQTTRDRLIERGMSPEYIHVVRPTISHDWIASTQSQARHEEIRAGLGCSSGDFLIGFFGPPSPLRGLSTLIEAVDIARRTNPAIKLLVFSRRMDGETRAEHRMIERLAAKIGAERWLHMETGIQPKAGLIEALSACDSIALPFLLVSSDVPLSVLEAMSLGVPVITTRVACLPEMTPDGTSLCIEPLRVSTLARKIQTLAGDVPLRNRWGALCRQFAAAWNTQAEEQTILKVMKNYDVVGQRIKA